MSVSLPPSWQRDMRVSPLHRSLNAAYLPWREALAALFCGVLIATAAGVSWSIAAGVALFLLVLGITRGRLFFLACVTIVFTVGVAERSRRASPASGPRYPLLSFPVGETHPSLQVVLPLMIAVLAVVSTTESGLTAGACFATRSVRRRRLLRFCSNRHVRLRVLSIWPAPGRSRDDVHVSVCLGRRSDIAPCAGSQRRHLARHQTPARGVPRLRNIVAGDLRGSASEDPGLARGFVRESVRVGFGTGIVYTLILPVGLLMLGRGGLARRERWFLVFSCAAIVAASVARSRASGSPRWPSMCS